MFGMVSPPPPAPPAPPRIYRPWHGGAGGGGGRGGRGGICLDSIETCMRMSGLIRRPATARISVPDHADEFPARVPPPAGIALPSVDSRVLPDARQLRHAAAGSRYCVP